MKANAEAEAKEEAIDWLICSINHRQQEQESVFLPK